MPKPIDPPFLDAAFAAVLAGIEREPVPLRLRDLAMRLEALREPAAPGGASVDPDRLAG